MNTGRTKLEKKKWTSSKPTESARVDDWLGSPPGGAKRKSYKIKSVSSAPPKVEEPVENESPVRRSSESIKDEVERLATKEAAPESKTVEPGAEPKPEPEPAETKVEPRASAIELNDASVYLALRKQKEGDTARNDEYVGASMNTGRTKLEKKKWTSSKPTESARVDDWLGSPPGGAKKKSYKVKSVSSTPPSR
jgi:hypothetical protein